MTGDLKPCPFCGGPAYAVWVVGSPYWKVRCDSYNCGISGPSAKSHGWAVRKWNRDARRPPMTSDAKLPIATYSATIDAGGNISPLEQCEDGYWCKADDVRGLATEIHDAVAGSRVIGGELDPSDPVNSVRVLVVACCEARNSNAILVDAISKAEAQRDRLVEVLRLALELAKDQDDNLGSWAEVWAQADEALAAINKENA